MSLQDNTKNPSGRKPIDMINKTFGLLFVINEADSSVPKYKAFNTVCLSCGFKKVTQGESLRKTLKSNSSGCKCSPRIKHGLSRHPCYKTWEGMIARCYSKNHIGYKNYGGRGITVCDEWRCSPKLFIQWIVSNGWKKGLQLDRRKNNKNYNPNNCRIVTVIENHNNTRRSRYLVINGEKITVAMAARKFEVGFTTIKARLDRGWSDIDSIKKPRKYENR